MRTTFRARQPYSSIFMKCAEEMVCESPARPERFIKKMKTNQGNAGMMGQGLDEEGLGRRNPVVAALGDSVTAGHFESLLPSDPKKIQAILKSMQKASAEDTTQQDSADFAIEVTDARESYLEKFRLALIDKYEKTSVCTINAGLAGDNLIDMEKRAYRDIIRPQPDLVLINGSLNWDEATMGSTADYKKILTRLVQRIKRETQADIILLTPNGDLPNRIPFFVALGAQPKEPSTPERVRAIREVAYEESVCLADVYAVWEAARAAGCPWEELLANGVNHPGVEGHEVYAKVLMKLFD